VRWLVRRRRFSLGRYVPALPGREATLDEIVDDGFLISSSAIRLAVKNRIILASLRDREDYSEERTRDVVREELLQLAREKDDDAEWAERESRAAAFRTGMPSNHSDFRAVDTAILERRREVSRALADRLRAVSEDDHFVTEVSDGAHAAAWEEIAASITARAALASSAPPDAAYPRERGDRMLGLLDDIAALDKARGDTSD